MVNHVQKACIMLLLFFLYIWSNSSKLSVPSSILACLLLKPFSFHHHEDHQVQNFGCYLGFGSGLLSFVLFFLSQPWTQLFKGEKTVKEVAIFIFGFCSNEHREIKWKPETAQESCGAKFEESATKRPKSYSEQIGLDIS